MVGVLGACAVGDGFHALHWYMLSCLCCCAVGSWFLSVMLRSDVGGLILRLEGFKVGRVVGLGVCGLVAFMCVCSLSLMYS